MYYILKVRKRHTLLSHGVKAKQDARSPST